jgi:hypothetical protein
MGAASNEWQGANPVGTVYASCFVAILHCACGRRRICHLAYLCGPCSYFWGRTSEKSQKAKFAVTEFCEVSTPDRYPKAWGRPLHPSGHFPAIGAGSVPKTGTLDVS